MGRPDDRHTKNQDYGRRLYVDDAPYEKQMGNMRYTRMAAFNQNTALYKQSEYKKPYREDDYEEMEYLMDGFPGFPFPWDYDTQPGAATSNPWHVVFLCDVLDSCYGRPDEECNAFKCGWNVLGYKVNSAPAGCTFKVTTGEICASCPEGTVGWIDFNITMQAKFTHNDATVTVEGTHYSLTINPCTGCVSNMAWDYVSSAAAIARSASVSVFITDNGGSGPYTWSVSGTGFTLDEVTTEGLENTLNADASACGMADIIVTGCDGKTTTGWVWCTTGSWGGFQDYCLGCNQNPGTGCIDYILDTPTGYRLRNTTWGCGSDLMLRTDCLPQCPWNYGSNPDLYPIGSGPCGDCGFPPLCRSGGQCTGTRWVFKSYWQQWGC